ncbi:MAG: hypothetical protein B6D64_02240 [Bacteroidetes bacterium 4484_276]|nr:MAG: hypothetical protein B6D64_02240 [Bacteroidetes bacterium 4484_276]
MKFHLISSAIIIAFSFAVLSATAQSQYTPYNGLPGIIKSYKPAYNSNYPEWARMLYEYPINYFDLIKLYENPDVEKKEGV